MATAGTVRVRGLKEVNRAFRRIETDVDDELRDKLKALAVPVAEDARSRLSRFQGASLSTIGPRAVMQGAFVTQRAKKVTGLRPDFGSLQMRVGLLPALAENESDVVEGVEDMLDWLGRKEGF